MADGYPSDTVVASLALGTEEMTMGPGEKESKIAKRREKMELKTGIYEVLTSDEASSVHGSFERIETTHNKQGWIKNVETQAVSQVTLTNFPMPLIPGSKIGMAFLNGEIIAFKRSAEIPVEAPSGKRSIAMAILVGIFATILFSIPVLGYIGGMVAGGYALITGENILGGYKKTNINRIYSAILLCLSTIAWFPAMFSGDDLGALISRHFNLAAILLIATVVLQVIKAKSDTKYYCQAVAGLNSAWRN
ncbi:TPA: hypothetical protein OT568_003840 [Pseudomonas aeruginosa]|nr:hypothetical protein [Pseudomonas aeruginosa]